MKNVTLHPLKIPGPCVVRFERFGDHRGFFAETYRRSDLRLLPGFPSEGILQASESFSGAGTLRGLHFQWNPFMGKLVRTAIGRMIGVVVDIRKGSPWYGKMVGYELRADLRRDFDEWLWIPPGFAYGNCITEETLVQYLQTAEHSPKSEAGVNPLSKDIDFSLMNPGLAEEFVALQHNAVLSDRDKNAPTMQQWLSDSRSDEILYRNLQYNK